jgi:hypothetical protein
MPIFGSDVKIKVKGVDVTDHVLYPSARFESQLGAVPGTADMILKDMDQSLDFTTGDEWTLDVDDIRQWGGFVLNAGRIFAFPAVDTHDPGSVNSRQWHLSGVDYNILFDKRVIRNPADYFHHLPFYALDKRMGELLRDQLFALYLDISGDGLDTTTRVDDLWVPHFDVDGNPDADASKFGSWPQQGSYWRKAMDPFAQFGAVYYINAAKQIVFTDVENTVAPWRFSDVPNKLPLPNAAATYGMREFEEIEDASAMANDAFVWGGSEWAGSSGGTVFARKQNTASITAHNRWQYAEVQFGELKDQGQVTARANVIVSGTTTGASGGDTARGLSVDQRQVRLAWWGHDVPRLAGVPAHLKAGDVVTCEMYVLSEDGINPLVVTVPLRSMRITFPLLRNDGTAYVRFDGFFGVQLSDPWWLWKFLRDFAPGAIRPLTIVATADGSSTSAIYGTLGSMPFNETPDSSRTVFSINFAYIAGTTQVYKGAAGSLVLQIPGTDYTESSPGAGEVTFTNPPATGQKLWLVCRIAGGLS